MDECRTCSSRYICGEEMEFRCKEDDLYLNYSEDYTKVLNKNNVTNNRYKELSKESNIKLREIQKKICSSYY